MTHSIDANTKADETNKRLNELLNDAYESARILVQKDRELVRRNEELDRITREMHETSKILVRRDNELSRAKEHLEESDRIKSEFVSVAAHQMRTPLTGIRWTLQGLLDGEFGAVSAEQQIVIRGALVVTVSAIDVINDLLNVARIDDERFGYAFVSRSMSEIAVRAVKTLMPKVLEKGIGLRMDISPDIPAMPVDEVKLSIVFENLIDNAIKYTLPGGVITVAGMKNSDSVVFSVSDTGIGIPKDQIPRIFSKFFRARNAMLMETSGTGLGLYVVKNILEKHGGFVSVVSTEGKGTTISLTLPYSRSSHNSTS